jgi:hypothetical protein
MKAMCEELELPGKERPTCSVVDGLCVAAANFSNSCRPVRIPSCFRCGEDVCRMCSTIRIYRPFGPKRPRSYGRKRLCNNCQVELDGNDAVVMRRMNRIALGA